jgi:phosphatidate cytidylyltransferase
VLDQVKMSTRKRRKSKANAVAAAATAAVAVDNSDSDKEEGGAVSKSEKKKENKENKELAVKSTEAKEKDPDFVKKVIIRAVSAVVMTILYLLMLQAGHFYCILVGVISQFEMFRELVNVRYVEAKERQMPLFRTLQWGYFFIAMLYAYGFFSNISKCTLLNVVNVGLCICDR